MNGILCGGNQISYDALRHVQMPEATQSYSPLAHHVLLDAVKEQVIASGLAVTQESYVVSNVKNGNFADRFFGLLEIRSEYSEYALLCGIRNSHDKVIPAGICCGSRVFVCSNLAFSAEVVIARRHTRFIERDLPGLINRAVGRLGDLRDQQHNRIEAYQNTSLSDFQMHDLAIRSMDAGVIAASKLPKVMSEYREPRHPEFSGRNVWSAFNAFTEILKEYDLQDLPRRTQALHGLCDMVSGMPGMTINLN